MQTNIKNLISLLLAFGLAVLSALPVFAGEPTVLEVRPPSGSSASTSTELEIENESQAEVENTATSTAQTGDNEAESESGSAAVVTGDANASMNVINLVNTTILGSNGTISIVNVFSAFFGNLDLSSSFDGNRNNECPGECSIFAGDLKVNNKNAAEITNDVMVRAGTGGNSSSGDGDALVVTGDANAAANIFNIANTNIIGSNYLLLVFNNFKDWGGSLIFPSKYAFGKCCPASNSTAEVTNNNSANIENIADTNSQTGENAAQGSDGIVLTGEANSTVNIINRANTNIFGSDSVFIILRYFGDWTGGVYSLPDGLSWTENDGEIAILSGEEGDSSLGAGSNTSIENKNSVEIKNNVKVFALTGKNKAEGADGNAVVATGDARAVANIANIANTNVVGRNWVFAIINIFGNWRGNVAFGQPDLWVGETVSNVPREVRPGHSVTYNLTVVNNGDTDATDVRLRDNFDERHLDPKNVNGGNLAENGEIFWDLGTLRPGEVKIISYDVSVKESLPAGNSSISNTAGVTSAEPDANNNDNTETTSIVLTRHREYEPNVVAFALPDFEIAKTHNATTTVKAGEAVDYKIILKNQGGGKGYEARIIDQLFYATGTDPIDEREWNLDTVYDSEEITVTYTLEISPEAKPGIYRNEAKFFAKDEVQVIRYIETAQSYIEVVADSAADIAPPIIDEISTSSDDISEIMKSAVRVFDEATRIIASASEMIFTLKQKPPDLGRGVFVSSIR